MIYMSNCRLHSEPKCCFVTKCIETKWHIIVTLYCIYVLVHSHQVNKQDSLCICAELFLPGLSGAQPWRVCAGDGLLHRCSDRAGTYSGGGIPRGQNTGLP